MVTSGFFVEQTILTTKRLRLEPLGPEHFDGFWAAIQNEESNRLTGTRQRFTEDQIHEWLAGLSGRHDRADWAVIRVEDGANLGEVVLHEFDEDNESIGFRIALASEKVFGRGYGTEATRAVVDHAFDDIGLHRVFLEVFSFNPRARHVYEKCGFIFEGQQRDALQWDGEWFDTIQMSMLTTDPRP